MVRASNGVSYSQAANKQAAIAMKKTKTEPNRNRGFLKTETENRTEQKKTTKKPKTETDLKTETDPTLP